ncbi:prolactin family 8, subfamily a, member 1 precursor [Mus musculus]|uniref:Growth hormone d16 n=1 Tax=Mus musculus TaxID=10090 RepID=Q9DAV8_MOUSE|nr:prolactin family 8, subfamily a, member 1 precursor [Mus musculus]AAI09186.1 Prolactin family 8, subfamily a, member 1 [Mus musculus]AAI09187.1 Prolactin family 8, subfamily a, member 1 [Mus musculus]AAN39706.1 placental prolactin-like protein-C delta [Mus musculus]EDL32431.1 prolactin-like protein C 4, isoform CRA_b [Mus musculus]CAI23982.1 prolactin family 8, subfamily a, member 1 [Mus musculus]|eukprot:NP_082753.1 prolactin family 8, subfamily a, member 1 precursor [Mus musculus]
MVLPLIQPHFCTFLLLVVSNLLLWEKTASISACHTDEEGCMKPLVETFNNAIQRAEIILNVSEQMHQEFLHNEFSSRHFTHFNSQLIRQDQLVLRARTYCHSTITNPSNIGPEYKNIKTKKYLKMLINFVGAWISPLYHLVIELSAMNDVPESILSKANEIEENNRELLNDLRWILTKVYPTAKMKKLFPTWEHLPSIKSTDKNYQFLAIFNLSHCLRVDIFYTKFHLRTLKCRITGKDC